jgi:hypothetical protein
MKPGNFLWCYPGDPKDEDLDVETELMDQRKDPPPPACRIPTCPGDMFVGKSIRASLNIFNTHRMNKLNRGYRAHLQSLFGQDESHPSEDTSGTARVSDPWGSCTCPTAPDGNDDGVDPGSLKTNHQVQL